VFEIDYYFMLNIQSGQRSTEAEFGSHPISLEHQA